MDGQEMNWTGLLVEACRTAGAGAGVSVALPESPCSSERPAEAIGSVARVSGFFTRRVMLSGEWYRKSGSSLVGFLGKDLAPVALLPGKSRGYNIVKPGETAGNVLTAADAGELLPEAFIIYRKLPDEPVTWKALIRFILPGNGREIRIIAVTGFFAAILGFAFPLLTGRVVDTVVPEASMEGMTQVALGLLVVLIAMGLFSATRSFTLVRLEGRLDCTIQAAVWRRLLSLPVDFFSRFTAGDLAFRSMGINTIRNILTALTVNSVMTVVFSSVNLLLMFLLDWQLAAVSAVLLGLQTICVKPLITKLLRYQSEVFTQQGKNAGQILQFLTGILKLRASAAEERAYGVWNKTYHSWMEAAYGAGRVDVILNSLNGMIPIVSTMFLYAIAASMHGVELSTGRFLAFIAAFAGLQNALVQMSLVAGTSLNIVPLYRRMSPILQATAENPPGRADPGTIKGEIEMKNVSFSYAPETGEVIRNVNLRIAPGEFVAITGASGSGKSTILRLLLGFNHADSGEILYDGKEIGTLDIYRLRRQIGIVLQDGKLMGGELYRCILGARNMDMDAAIEAARAAGLEDEIKALPMGMETVIPPGGETFSGGQCQRILIARALVSKPVLLYFDEATSALDNRSQTLVSKSISELGAARLVIAHRLSTIRKADRIYVLEQGSFTETGTYAELMELNGTFRKLAERQLI